VGPVGSDGILAGHGAEGGRQRGEMTDAPGWLLILSTDSLGGPPRIEVEIGLLA